MDKICFKQKISGGNCEIDGILADNCFFAKQYYPVLSRFLCFICLWLFRLYEIWSRQLIICLQLYQGPVALVSRLQQLIPFFSCFINLYNFQTGYYQSWNCHICICTHQKFILKFKSLYFAFSRFISRSKFQISLYQISKVKDSEGLVASRPN